MTRAGDKWGESQGASQGGARRKPRILLAEDDEAMRALLCESLAGAGYDVVALSDGLELMEHLAAYLEPDARLDVDLIVSDIRMPWVSGLELLRSVKEYVGYPGMILITAFGDDEIHAEARRLGAAAILNKPFDVEELLARIRESIPSRRVAGP